MVKKIKKKDFKGVVPNDKKIRVNQIELQRMIDERMNKESLNIRTWVQTDVLLTVAYALRNLEGWGNIKLTRTLKKSLEYLNDIHLQNEKYGFTFEDVKATIIEECKVDVVGLIEESAKNFNEEYMEKFTRGKEKA